LGGAGHAAVANPTGVRYTWDHPPS
jgi:hypothetical protein